MSELMIDVQGLTKSFDDTVIFENVSMQVNRGETIAIIGPSGCGKSTFLRCLNRMETPTSGSINVMGADILDKNADVNALRARVGMVYQQFHLFSHLNVIENMILAPMQTGKMKMDEAVAEAETLLKRMGMANRKYHMPHQLSGGQKQRVAIMRCMMMKPEIILFDEPTSALDPTMVDEVEYVIRTLVKEGMTSLIVTHEMDFARSVANRVAYFDENGLYEMGTPQEIFDAPKGIKTRMFVEKLNALEKEITVSTDLLTLMSEVRAFCVPYGFTGRQMRAVEALLDEVAFAILNAEASQSVNFRLYCSNKSNQKEAVLVFPNLKEDPLAHRAVDSLGLKILGGFTSSLTGEKTDEGWCVKVTIKDS